MQKFRGDTSRVKMVHFNRLGSVFLLALVVCDAPRVQAGRGADGVYEQRRSSHFVLYQDVDIDRTSGFYGTHRFEKQVLEVLERAYDQLESMLGMRPRREIQVTVHDPEIFDSRFARIFRFPAAGFYGGTIHVRGGAAVSNRMVRTLYHELVHAAFDAELPSLILPAWFNEGIAEWFEARSMGRSRLTARELSFLAELERRGGLFQLSGLSSASFGGFGPEAARVAYLQSFSFFEFIARRFGERRIRDLNTAVIRTSNIDAAFRRTLRKNLASLESMYLEDLRSAGY